MVYYQSRSRQWSGTVSYPMIRLAGKFLQEFGFHVHDDIEVVYEEGKITITKQGRVFAPGVSQEQTVASTRNETLPLSQSLGNEP
jgi:hypothetical protein